MGNSLRGEQQDWRHILSPLPIDPSYDYLTHWKNSSGDLFLGRQIELPQYLGLQILKSRLQKRERNTAFQSASIYPLNQCYFQRISSLCSQQEHCLLTCVKPKLNLQKCFEDSKGVPNSFSIELIHLTINNIGKALKTINELGESFCPLRMAHIVLKDNLYLMDPILVENDPFGYGTTGEYPAPQQISSPHSQNRKQIGKEAMIFVQLFSLGIIALQLYHSSIKIKDIYVRYQKYGSIVGINGQMLKELIQAIGDINLRAKIAILTNPHPNYRNNIYDIIANQHFTQSQIQTIIKQMENKITNASNSPLPIANHSYNKTPVLKQAKKIQNKIVSPSHSHLQKKEQKAIEISNKPRVSINFISKIHNNSIIPQNTVVRNTLTFIPPQTGMVRPRNNQNFNQTPIRIKKKHNFSTIKEVSQQCASTSRLKTFQDVSINGRYEGDQKSGKRHGKGIFYFQQGSIYQGQWRDDQMHGFGKLYYPSGKLAYEGQWKNNEFSGKGIVYNNQPLAMALPFDFTDFTQIGQQWISYQGTLYQDQRQGVGYLMLSNGEEFRGSFSEDKIHGAGQFLTLQGKVIRGVWSNCILQRTFNQ